MYIKTLSGKMRWFFLLSIILMMAHKFECFQTAEWKFAPAYLYILDLGLDKGEMLFLTFVTMMFVGLLWCFIIIAWRYGQLLFLAFWGLTFILELHHLIRSLVSGSYYSGFYTAIVYVLFGFIYWRELSRHFHFKETPGN
ncbi:MAG: HXXEE domain-containing protein [Bacteroidota bacterium]|nr:HXXEE domain-containing protein [Bacteroidota bacterium]